MNGQTPKTTRYPLPGGGTAELQATGGTREILHGDWLGSARLSTLYTDQTVANDTAYSPFGETYNNTSNSNLNFTGQSQDTVTGLYDFPYREYSTVGRWISPDPAGLSAVDSTNPQSWNRYAYALNNPLSFKDPTGLECVWDDGSYDSNDDPDTGSAGSCSDAGGSWVDHSYFQSNGLKVSEKIGFAAGAGRNFYEKRWYSHIGRKQWCQPRLSPHFPVCPCARSLAIRRIVQRGRRFHRRGIRRWSRGRTGPWSSRSRLACLQLWQDSSSRHRAAQDHP
jgi:RHS repeat-associated protein